MFDACNPVTNQLLHQPWPIGVRRYGNFYLLRRIEDRLKFRVVKLNIVWVVIRRCKTTGGHDL